jgi:hypothetical protein
VVSGCDSTLEIGLWPIVCGTGKIYNLLEKKANNTWLGGYTSGLGCILYRPRHYRRQSHRKNHIAVGPWEQISRRWLESVGLEAHDMSASSFLRATNILAYTSTAIEFGMQAYFRENRCTRLCIVANHNSNIKHIQFSTNGEAKSRHFPSTILDQRINEPRVFLSDSAIPKKVSASRTLGLCLAALVRTHCVRECSPYQELC